MSKRAKMPKGKDQAVFRRTASKTKKMNINAIVVVYVV